MEEENNVQWFSIPDKHFDLYGVMDNFQRMPKEMAEAISAGVARHAVSSAGGRLRFMTNSKKIRIRAHMVSERGVGFDLYRLVDNAEYFAAGFMSRNRPINEGWFEAVREVGDGMQMQVFTLNLPYIGMMDSLSVGIDERAEITPGARYINELPVVFYGSSITQGRCASRPGMTYEAQISQKYNMNYLNMGINGNAKAEPLFASYLAKIPMIAFVCDYDHNAPDAEHLKQTHLPLYLTIREENPDIPYIIVTKPDFFKAPERNQIRADVIRETFDYAKAHGDTHVFFVDGKKFFNGDYYHACTMDGTHPNDLGFYRIAADIGDVVADALGLEKRVHDFIEY